MGLWSKLPPSELGELSIGTQLKTMTSPLPESISSQGRVGQVFLVTIYCRYSMQERTRQAKQEGRVSVQGRILLRNGKKELHYKYFNSFIKIIVWFKI